MKNENCQLWRPHPIFHFSIFIFQLAILLPLISAQYLRQLVRRGCSRRERHPRTGADAGLVLAALQQRDLEERVGVAGGGEGALVEAVGGLLRVNELESQRDA